MSFFPFANCIIRLLVQPEGFSFASAVITARDLAMAALGALAQLVTAR